MEKITTAIVEFERFGGMETMSSPTEELEEFFDIESIANSYGEVREIW